jgi:hypothetical protein
MTHGTVSTRFTTLNPNREQNRPRDLMAKSVQVPGSRRLPKPDNRTGEDGRHPYRGTLADREIEEADAIGLFQKAHSGKTR